MTRNACSIAIATHNRREDLSITLDWLRRFHDDVAEILVCADGCTDGTKDFITAEHPDITLMENNPGRGSIPSRNRMIRAAKSDFVLLLDDDSYPMEDGFFADVESVMDQHPDIGALTFPQRSDEFPETLEQADFGPALRVGTFTSSGTVLRRALFDEMGGFPELFFHAYEEPDYSLRLHAAGYRIVQWTHLTVRHHFTNAMRNEGRTHRRHARNECWSTLMRSPLVLIVPMLAYRIFSQGRYAASRGAGWLIREPAWWWEALKGAPRAWRFRKPVEYDAYRSWLKLMRSAEPFKEEAT